MFGLLGLFVAVAATPIGRAVDSHGSAVVNTGSMLIGLVGYVVCTWGAIG